MSKPQKSATRPFGFIDYDAQGLVDWRSDHGGDVVCAVPGKSGTTWTMNIVHQLRERGDPDFKDIYVEVPWLEFAHYPEESSADIAKRIDDLPRNRFRIFKSHASPPTLPFDPSVRYIVVVRNVEESMVSLHPFFAKHNPEFLEWFGVRSENWRQPDFPTFFEKVILPRKMLQSRFTFIRSWWQYRNEKNVMILHFADMKADHEGSVRKIAKFLNIEPTEDEWSRILEYTSFPWMKAHEEKFEIRYVCSKRPLLPGAMMRKGKVGCAAEDGMTSAIAYQIRQAGIDIIGDNDVLKWVYEGGPLPPTDLN